MGAGLGAGGGGRRGVGIWTTRPRPRTWERMEKRRKGEEVEGGAESSWEMGMGMENDSDNIPNPHQKSAWKGPRVHHHTHGGDRGGTGDLVGDGDSDTPLADDTFFVDMVREMHNTITELKEELAAVRHENYTLRNEIKDLRARVSCV